MVGESMAATMTVGLHESLNENVHGGKKERNSIGLSQNARSEHHGTGWPAKDHLRGFMVAS
jgi:hypothetical protein